MVKRNEYQATTKTRFGKIFKNILPKFSLENSLSRNYRILTSPNKVFHLRKRNEDSA